MNEELNSFVTSLFEETMLAMDEYQTPEMAFTATVLDKIEELLDCKDIVKEHCKIIMSNGNVSGEIHAYGQSTNEEVLYLFYTNYNSSNEIVVTSNTESQKYFNRLQGFYNSAIRGSYFDMDTSSNEYRAAKFIYENVQKFQTVNLILLSNCIINNFDLKKIKIVTKSVFSDVWDLKKIYGNTHSMSDHVAIDIDFGTEEYDHYKIPFIQMESTQYGYKCIQAICQILFRTNRFKRKKAQRCNAKYTSQRKRDVPCLQ